MKKNIIMAKEKEKENRQRKVTVDIKIENLPSHEKRPRRILKNLSGQKSCFLNGHRHLSLKILNVEFVSTLDFQ